MQQRYFRHLHSLIHKVKSNRQIKYKFLILKFYISATSTQFPPFTGVVFPTGTGSGDCPSPQYQGYGNTGCGVYEIKQMFATTQMALTALPHNLSNFGLNQSVNAHREI